MHRSRREPRLILRGLALVVAGATLSVAPPSSASAASSTRAPASSKAAPAPKAAPAAPAAPSAAVAPVAAQALAYPASRAADTTDNLFGTVVKDPYRWLEDVKSPEVQSWMAAQDKLARDILKAEPGREALAKRLHELIYIDSVSAPEHRGTRYFYSRRFAEKEKAVYFWKEGENGKEQVLIDPNTLSADGSISVSDVSPTLDGKLVAYSLHPNNADGQNIQVMEVATGKVRESDTIKDMMWTSPSWSPSGDGYYYTWLPPRDPKVAPPDRMGLAEVRFHKLGTSPDSDKTIYPSLHDPTRWLGADVSRDGHWLFVDVENDSSDADIYFRDTRKKDQTFKPLVVGTKSANQVTAWKDRFYLFTNLEAPHGRVVVIDPANPARDKWKEIVPESKEAVLEGVQVRGGHLVLTWLRNASSALEVRKLDGSLVRKVPLPGLGSTVGMKGNPDDDKAYFGFSSFTHPPEVYETSIASGETKLWTSVKVPIDPTPFTVEQVWYPSKDGTKISMFLVHRKDMPKDGSTPFYLTGYGGFTISEDASFRSGLFAWLEAGGGFALPNLRGGGEYGEEWHKAGMLDKKQNVFDDFIAAGEFLVNGGYTRPAKLAIEGGSNGGLLVGAVATQRPDLFGAVICAVPLLDMVRYHMYGTGKAWVSEYGSAENEAQFKTLYAYSPYHRITAGTAYPALLMMSADSDDRVDPMHARKFTAALQASSTSGKPILLRIETNAGHGGGDQKKKYVDTYADEYSFLMRELGMTPPGEKQ